MLNIRHLKQFKKDYKKSVKQNRNIETLKSVITKLANDEKLETKYKDHKLTGSLKDYRECHIEPDWLLIYQKNEIELVLVRLGTHSELFN